ncbi:MAG: sigma factor-like helix-turn-helix DNA-binding protein [Anaerobutyricum soehngenii]
MCIQLFYCEGLKIKEIAERLNISEGTVKSRLYNGLEKVECKSYRHAKRGLYTFTMALTGVLLMDYFQRRLQCKRRLFRITKAQNFMAQNALQQAKNMAAANGAGQAKEQ